MVIHLLQAFSNVIFRTVVQQVTRFQLTLIQGWARDVKPRDRDAHLPRPRPWLHQPRRDRDETLKSRDETKT